MLTPAERREKKLRRLFDDTGVEELTAVYRCGGAVAWGQGGGWVGVGGGGRCLC